MFNLFQDLAKCYSSQLFLSHQTQRQCSTLRLRLFMSWVPRYCLRFAEWYKVLIYCVSNLVIYRNTVDKSFIVNHCHDAHLHTTDH